MTHTSVSYDFFCWGNTTTQGSLHSNYSDPHVQLITFLQLALVLRQNHFLLWPRYNPSANKRQILVFSHLHHLHYIIWMKTFESSFLDIFPSVTFIKFVEIAIFCLVIILEGILISFYSDKDMVSYLN